jgi:cell division protein FtsW (lipid II flippase)
MLEMSSSSFIDKSRRRFKTKFREYIETQKSKMRSIQNRNSFLTKSLIYIFAGVIITAVSLYFELFIKKTTFGMMIVLFQIISIVIILTIGVYVFFFRGKD